MTLRDEALGVLLRWEAGDQTRLRDRYVEHLRRHVNGASRECTPDHLTASMLVLSADRAQVLLVLHAKARRWFQPGGHCEPSDQTLVGAATREAVEETGITGLTVDPVPISLDEHPVAFCSPGTSVHHLDVRFLAVAPPDAAQAVSAESLDVRWWPIEQLPTDDPGLVDLVRRGLARVEAQSTSGPG